jgi:3-keto-5-aminohexanoate cleavage enzyme
MSATWLEVALNGPWGRSRRSDAPLTVAEIVADGVACVRAGASVVHVHAYNADGEPDDDPDIYAAIMEGIRGQVDAIVYPTIPLAGFPGADDAISAEARYAHEAALARRGLLEWAVVDPGTVNFARYDAVARDEVGFVYLNPEAHVRAALAIAARWGFSPSYAIYEPGFLRLGAALARRYPGIGPPIYRFMFTETYTFGFPPEPWALDAYLRLLDREAPGAPWMVAGLGVDVSPLIAVAVARGGHVRVGLEDAPPGDPRTNLEWVTQASAAIQRAGGTLAVPDQVRVALATTGAGA